MDYAARAGTGFRHAPGRERVLVFEHEQAVLVLSTRPDAYASVGGLSILLASTVLKHLREALQTPQPRTEAEVRAVLRELLRSLHACWTMQDPRMAGSVHFGLLWAWGDFLGVVRAGQCRLWALPKPGSEGGLRDLPSAAPEASDLRSLSQVCLAAEREAGDPTKPAAAIEVWRRPETEQYLLATEGFFERVEGLEVAALAQREAGDLEDLADGLQRLVYAAGAPKPYAFAVVQASRTPTQGGREGKGLAVPGLSWVETQLQRYGSPAQAQRAEARRIAARYNDPQALWEVYASEGLVPMAWLESPARRFLGYAVQQTVAEDAVYEALAEGQRQAWILVEPVERRAGRCRLTWRRTELYPPTKALCVAMAADVEGVLHAERLAREVALRAKPFGAGPVRRMLWQQAGQALRWEDRVGRMLGPMDGLDAGPWCEATRAQEFLRCVPSSVPSTRLGERVQRFVSALALWDPWPGALPNLCPNPWLPLLELLGTGYELEWLLEDWALLGVYL